MAIFVFKRRLAGGARAMQMTKTNILYLEHDEPERNFFQRFASTANLLGCDFTIAGSTEEALDFLKQDYFDAVVLNFSFAEPAAYTRLETVSSAPIILIMQPAEQDIAVSATKSKADSYLLKDPRRNYLKTLPMFLQGALRRNRAEQEIEKLKTHLRNFEKLAEERIIDMQREVDAHKHPAERLQVFQRFVEQSQQGMVIASLFGIIVYCNPALARILGEDSPGVMVGKSLFAYYPADVQQRLKNEILPVVLRQGHWTGELPVRRLNNDCVQPIANYLFVSHDPKGKPLSLANILTDYTRWKQAEEETY